MISYLCHLHHDVKVFRGIASSGPIETAFDKILEPDASCGQDRAGSIIVVDLAPVNDA